MNILTELDSLSLRDGKINLQGGFVFGDDNGGDPAVQFATVSDERSVLRITIYTVSRSLDERYARFCKRLSIAIEKYSMEVAQ